MTILAIDPGSTQSGWCIIEATTRRPLKFGKWPNHDALSLLHDLPGVEHVAVEMVSSYGMPVGAEVFATVRWIGRFEQALVTAGHDVNLVYRRDVKHHHCHSSKAKDSNITRALVDRFAAGESNYGKGIKSAPGWFHGFRADVWQSYALAVYVADTLEAGDPL